VPRNYVRTSTRKFLTPEQKEQLRRLSEEEGWSDTKIADHFGIKRQRVYEIRMRMGLGLQLDAIRTQLLEDMEFLLEKAPTLTQKDLAELLEISQFRVNYMMMKTGWKMQGHRRHNKIWVKNG
jgi:hypothetical protein